MADAAAEYAKKENISNIVGSEFMLRITEDTVLSFPLSGEDRRERT